MPTKIKQAPIGGIFEWRNDIHAFDIARRVRDNGAALFIDYGHVESDVGETLQSVNEHAFADPLSAPGAADVTAHVDFFIFGQAAESMGAAVQGPVTQALFLRELGIDARADALRRGASAEQGANITAAVARLTEAGRTGMGELFKVMALRDPKLGPLPGFAPV
jgi:SAM-dependent MidA family methyltransferase